MTDPIREDDPPAERLSEEVSMEGSFGVGILKEMIGIHGSFPLTAKEMVRQKCQNVTCK